MKSYTKVCIIYHYVCVRSRNSKLNSERKQSNGLQSAGGETELTAKKNKGILESDDIFL